MMWARLILVFAVVVCMLLTSEQGSATTIMTVEGELQRHALPLDPATLSRYLTEGVPEGHQPRDGDPMAVASYPFRRWELYLSIAKYLGQAKSKVAAPALLEAIESELPRALQLDLDIHVAGYSGYKTWNEWDIAEREKIATFRAACAESLARIGHKASLPPLKDYLESFEERITAELIREKPDSAYLWAFSRTCRAITALGDKAGIDALIASLDDCPIVAPETIINYLRISTGQPFGPEYDQPLHLRPAEIQKWKDWWETNKTSFVIDETKVITQTKPDLPKPAPRTLRDHVAFAETRYMGYDGTGWGRYSTTWLEDNSQRYVSELLRLTNDPNEPSRVRGEAMDWFAKFAGPLAFPILRDFATDDACCDTQTETLHLRSKALKLIDQFFPAQVDEVAKDCLRSSVSVSQGAFHILAKNPENRAYLVESFHSLVPNVQHQAIQGFIQYENPIAREVFFHALKSDDRGLAIYAALGVRRFNLSAVLPEDARVAHEAWLRNPEFVIGLTRRDDGLEWPLQHYQKALLLIQSTDVNAARAYRLALDSLQQLRAYNPAFQEKRGTVDALIDDAQYGLQSCVRSYRQSRGRSGA